MRVAAQFLKAIPNRLRRHALQPQALYGFRRFVAKSVLFNQAKNQLALAPRVTGVDQFVYIFAFGLFHHGGQAAFGFVHGLDIKVRRNHWQMRKAPFAAFDLVALGRLNL